MHPASVTGAKAADPVDDDTMLSTLFSELDMQSADVTLTPDAVADSPVSPSPHSSTESFSPSDEFNDASSLITFGTSVHSDEQHEQQTDGQSSHMASTSSMTETDSILLPPVPRPAQFREPQRSESCHDPIKAQPDTPQHLSNPGRRRKSRSATEQVLPTTSKPRLRASLVTAPFSHKTWRNSLGEANFNKVEKEHSRTELERQQVIWELCQTEDAFVSSMQAVAACFFTPLKDTDGKWLSSIPKPITRLFDCFYEIVHLHAQILRAIDLTRWSQPHIVMRLAPTLLPFVPRLDVHLPYLVHFERVTRMIDLLVADADSEFGSLVRMQQQLPECGHLTLCNFLLTPVQRLMKYPLFFEQLLKLTPKEHVDHLDTVELLQSTDTAIRVMQEVKSREDDFKKLKTIEARIHGLPPTLTLAKRDRRLLAHGHLKLHSMTEKQPHPMLSRSLRSSIPLLRQKSDQGPLSKSTNSISALSSAAQSDYSFKVQPKHGLLYVFVFNDVVVFTVKSVAATSMQEQYDLVSDYGVARVKSVEDVIGRNDLPLLKMELLPIHSDNEIDAMDSSAPVTCIYLSPPRQSGKTSDSTSKRDLRYWQEAFRRCSSHAKLSAKPSQSDTRTTSSADPQSIAWWSARFETVKAEMQVENGVKYESKLAAHDDALEQDTKRPSTRLQTLRSKRWF